VSIRTLSVASRSVETIAITGFLTRRKVVFIEFSNPTTIAIIIDVFQLPLPTTSAIICDFADLSYTWIEIARIVRVHGPADGLGLIVGLLGSRKLLKNRKPPVQKFQIKDAETCTTYSLATTGLRIAG
jgi:hypothetical protein